MTRSLHWICFWILFDSCWNMARTLMHWIMTTRLHYIWRLTMAAPKVHGYYWSMARTCISRIKWAGAPYKLRGPRSRGCHAVIVGAFAESAKGVTQFVTTYHCSPDYLGRPISFYVVFWDFILEYNRSQVVNLLLFGACPKLRPHLTVQVV